MVTENTKGIFVDISSAVAADLATITEISAHKTPTETVEFSIALEIRDLGHLQLLLKHLRQMESVISARRV